MMFTALIFAYKQKESIMKTFNSFFKKNFISSLTLFLLFIISGTANASCAGCDCSLDKEPDNNGRPGVLIPDLDQVDHNVTTCFSGESANDDKDYYHFTTTSGGILHVLTSSPNGHKYHMGIESNKQGTLLYDTAKDRNLTYALKPNEKITFYFKETGSDTDKYQANLSFTKSNYIEDADDICYVGDPQTSGLCTGFGGLNCTKTITLKSLNDITNVQTIIDASSLASGSMFTDCGVDGTSGKNKADNEDGSCKENNAIDMGPAHAFNKGVQYNLASDMPQDANHSIYDYALFDISFFKTENLYATYSKNGKKYRGKIKQCTDGYCPNISEGDRDFTIRNPQNTRNIHGNYVVIGNQNICTDHNEDGTCVGDTKTTSNSHPSLYVDVDNNNSTVNSSSSTLAIPSGAKVVWAGLYWQGTIHNSDNDNNRYDEDFGRDNLWVQGNKIIGATNVDHSHKEIDLLANNNGHGAYNACKVELKVPGKGYVEVAADQLDYYQLGYGGYADVTKLLDADNPNGVYTVADIKSQTGKETSHGNYAAWSLVVIYEKDSEKFRNISLFDGYVTVNSEYRGELHMDGFLTRKAPPVRSKLAFFTLDGDGGTNSISIDDQKISNTNHPADRFFNSTINSNIVRDPDYVSARVDLDYIDLVDVLKPSQTSAVLKPRSGGDRYTASYFIMSADLRLIDICYDYTYGQNGFYQTAPSIKPARVEGTFTSDPIDVKLYFKNQENSDVTIKNLYVNIDPIDSNTTYKSESTYVTKPGGTITKVDDSNHNTSRSYNNDIPIGDVGSLDYFYTYYSLNHSRSDINASIKATLKYDLVIKAGDQNITLNSSSTNLKDMSACQEGASYKPTYGRFNIVHRGQSRSDNTDPFYYFNLPTQVVNRYTDNYLVESMNPNDVNKSMAGVKDHNVTVEMIDVAGFHYASASCTDQNATVVSSQSVLAVFDDNNSYTTDLNKTDMQNAAFFSRAVQNAAFKLGYFKDANATQRTYICSRDNFAIRPEAFLLSLDDQNQSTSSTTQPLPIPTTSGLDLAADYNYKLKVIATQHTNDQPSAGYNHSFSSDDEALYKWEPRSITASNANLYCNDRNDSNITGVNFNNSGTAELNTSVKNVGEYRLHLEDKTWTKVDNNSIFMTHHNNSYFKSGADCNKTVGGEDRVSGDATATLNGCYISSQHHNLKTGAQYNDFNVTFHPYMFDLSGISLNTGLNFTPATATSFVYMADISQDENMSYHIVGAIIPKGRNGATLSNFVDKCYATPLDINISTPNRDLNDTKGNHVAFKVRFHDLNSSGSVITADDMNATETIAIGQAEDIHFLTVQSSSKGYFPKDLQGTMSTRLNMNYSRKKNATVNPKRLGFITYKVNGTKSFYADLQNNKVANGSKDLNSTTFYYGRAHAAKQRYVVPDDAPYNANIYYEIFCFGAGCDTAPSTTLLPSTQHVDDIRWYQNTLHNPSNDGNVTNVVEKGTINKVTSKDTAGHDTLNNTTSPATVNLTYDGSLGYPYTTTMEVNASNWLIYNEDNASAKTNSFQVEFNKAGNGWVGKHETNAETNTTGAVKTNRRTMW